MPSLRGDEIRMSQSDLDLAIMQAEAAILKMKLDNQRRLHQVEADTHNIAMLLVQVTELRAARALGVVMQDD